MLTWFIVAIVTFHNGEIKFEQMQKPFATKELCQQYYQSNMDVRNDVLRMHPTQRGHTLICLTKKQIQDITVQDGVAI